MIPIDEVEPPSSRRWWRLAMALVPVTVFVGLLAFGLTKSAPSAVQPGKEAPEFTLPRLNEAGTLSSTELRGHPVVINFWASWCVPCREEAPLLEKTYLAYRDKGVIFLGINIKDAKSSALDFMKEFGITYPNARDLQQELVQKLGITGVPETFFVDDKWRFVSSVSGPAQGDQGGTRVLGPISEDDLTTNIEILLNRQSSSSGS